MPQPDTSHPTADAGHPWPPHYYRLEGGLYHPSGLSRSPWNPRAIAGGPISALLATGAEDEDLDADFSVARMSIDILGIVPRMPLEMRVIPVKLGRQTLLHRVELVAAGRPAAQAHILRVRHLETPQVPVPHTYPAPDSVSEGAFLVGAAMAGAIRSRPIAGAVHEPGRGTCWLTMEGEVVQGQRPSPFVCAALFADFGNGVGSATRREHWSYANLDITLQFLRMPVGEWLLIDAETHMAGNGHGTASNVFADRHGVYARGFQTVFVQPGPGA